tara:strand:- start:5687 stop:7264 length:1578 start_codon:yes stop_codon:yes gene_type:complete
MAGTDSITSPTMGAYPLVNPSRNGKSKKPILEKEKSVGYSATQSDQIFAISSAADGATKEGMPSSVEITNIGKTPLMIMAGYESYTHNDDTLDTDVVYLHTMLLPNETYYPPIRAIAKTHASSDMTVIVDGTVVDNQAPNSNEYVDSAANADSATSSGVISSNSSTTLYLEPYTSAADCTANLFRVGDLIRLTNEIMEVTAIGDKSDLANNTLTVKRGVHGSTAASDHADGDDVLIPFFNAYHDFDKYSVAQTDHDGKFKAMNFFGLGRAATKVQGITAGSVALKFYESGYQSLGLSGITSSTHSGLTASTAYKIDITVDGGSLFEDLTFTTDSSNLNFGGKNGIIAKIQAALDVQFYTTGNLFEKKVTVGIVDGDIRFTSGSHLSTSAILLADTTDSGSFIDAAANGRIPAAANIPSPVAAKLPDDVTYDRVTYATIPNDSKFVYDDGKGNLFGAAEGTINYETGAIDFKNAPPNAEFVISCMHTSAFSGKLNESEADRINSLIAIHANTPNQKMNGSVKVRTY